MPIFEVEYQGQTYEVDAPDEASAVAVFAPQQAAPAPAPVAQGPQPGQGLTQAMEARLGAAIASGVPEGVQRIGGALKQLGGNAKDFYRALVEGKPYKKADTRDPATGQVIRGQVIEDSAGRNATATEILRQTLATAESKEEGVSQALRSTFAGATELGAAALAPEAAIPRATTFMGAAAKNALSNVVGSFLTFDADNRQGQDVLIGAAFSPVITPLTASGPALLNTIGRKLQATVAEGRTGDRVAMARNVLPNTDFTLAQITGIPELKALERSAYDSTLVNFYADQTDNLVRDFRSVLEIPPSTSNNLDTAFAKARTGADQRLSALKSNASQAWDKGMANAAEIEARLKVKPSAGTDVEPAGVQYTAASPPVDSKYKGIPVTNLSEQIKATLQETSGPFAELGQATKLGPLAKRALQGVADTKNMSVRDFSEFMKRLTAMSQSNEGVDRAIAYRLRSAVERDLDVLEGSDAATLNAAVKQVLETRAEYRRAMGIHAAYANSTAYKLMGVGEDVEEVAPQDLLARFKNFDPQRQRSITSYMEAHAPGMLEGMKNEAVSDVIRRAGKIGPAADSAYDLDRFVEALTNPAIGDELRTVGLWNSQELRKLDAVTDGIRAIYNNRPGLGGAGTQIKPEDIAPNLVSRSGIFIARQATRIFMSAKASQFFTDPRIQELLTKSNRSTTGSTANLAARAALLELMQTEYSTDEEQPQ